MTRQLLIIALAIVVAALAMYGVVRAALPVVDRFASVEYFGYVMSESNPAVGRRTLCLTRSEISRHDPIANLAFGVNDDDTYAATLLLLDKPVRLFGVEVDRGGSRWLLVEKLTALK